MDDINIIISGHARKHLNRERTWITEKQIQQAINNPDQIVSSIKHSGRKVIHKRVVLHKQKYLLRIFCEYENEKTLIVISYYYTSKIDKYWRETDENNL